MAEAEAAAPTRLARRLGLADAVVVGVGAMLGAGVFVAIAPAAGAAGGALVVGLGVAGVVAFCNATSSARLAALYPTSGGTYVYGRERLGAFWGYLAGAGFVVGKLASCAAMALTFGSYVAPAAARPLALAATATLTAVNLRGIDKTAGAIRIVVAIVLGALGVFVVAALTGGTVSADRLSLGEASPPDVLRSAAFLFFAFAGYARLATLGEEVRAPARTIPRAIAISLTIVLAVYAVVCVTALVTLGPAALAASSRPLHTALVVGSHASLAPIVQVGAATACLGVLVSLLAGVSRTTFAMAANQDLPGFLAAVRPRTRTPYLAELLVGLVVGVVVAFVDVRNAIGFSSFCVLLYYAIANASALTLGTRRAVPLFGLLGCVTLAFALPLASVTVGSAVIAATAALYAVRRALVR